MSIQWANLAALPGLPAGELQLYRLDVTALDPAVLNAAAEPLLNAEEAARAARMRPGLARSEFLGARLLLRRLLGNLLDLPPVAVPFVFNHNQKPVLPGEPAIAFNLAHSHGLVLLALARSAAVGVDLERLDEAFAQTPEMLEIARQSFSPDDLRSIELAASPTLRTLRFYQCWTAREALAKTEGKGIATPFVYAPLAIDATGERRISFSRTHQPRTTEYFLRTLDVAPQFAAAVAVAEPGLRFSYFDATSLVETKTS